MLLALLFTIFPTLLVYILLPKIGLQIKSLYLKISFAWFAGTYLFTILIFLLAVCFSYFTSAVLLKASIVAFVPVCILLIYYNKDLSKIKTLVSHQINIKNPSIRDILLILFCLAFSVIFFIPHLAFVDGTIYKSPIYWDFHWHAALIQNFAFGDNFPPQNESFSGLPHTYHYFWGVVTAIYDSLGLDLVNAINYISILSFFFLLITIIGISEELLQSKLIGFIAVFLTLTSSSLHFIDYFLSLQNINLLEIAKNIIFNTEHPFTFSFIYKDGLVKYNGTMFNLFYFLEERQMIFGAIYLLISFFIIYKRNQLSNKVLFIIGCLMGAFFLWHLFVTIMVLCALIFILIIDKKRKKTLYLFSGFGIIFLLHYIYFKALTHSQWFYSDITSYPKLNFTFSRTNSHPFTFYSFITYYVYAYGLKLILLPISLFVIWKKNKKLFKTICAICLPTFILVNTVQLSPAEIYENHKWLRPMNIIIDIFTAFIVVNIFFKKKNIIVITLGILCMFFITISGFMELTPFINSRPTDVYAAYTSSYISDIRMHTPPKATFIGEDTYQIQLAGRKLFLGDYLGSDLRLNKTKREEIINDIFDAKKLTDFCHLTRTYNIDYVEYVLSKQYNLLNILLKKNYFETTIDDKKVIFLETEKACE